MKLISTLSFSLVLLLCSGASVKAQTTEWDALYLQAFSLFKEGEYDRAVVVTKKALSVAETDLAADHACVADSLALLGSIYVRQGQYELAEAFFRYSLPIYVKVRGPNDAHVVFIRKTISILQFKNSSNKAIVSLPTNSSTKATVSKVVLPKNSTTINPIVQCFTSDKVKMIQYNKNAMAKLVKFNKKKRMLTVQTQHGTENYGTSKRLDSSTINNLLSFARTHRDLYGNAPDKYVSYEFLAKLKSPEEIREEYLHRQRQPVDSSYKIREIEMKIQQLEMQRPGH